MQEIAAERLIQERKDWRRDHPHCFYAKNKKKENGTQDLFNWECGIPGPVDSPWQGGLYKLVMEFPEDYPVRPPKCRFTPPLFHPNIYPSGAVCLSILNEEEDWKPTLKIADILLGIQNLLKNPNNSSPAQLEAYTVYSGNIKEYEEKVKKIALEHRPKL